MSAQAREETIATRNARTDDQAELTVRERLIAAATAVIADVGEEQLTLAQVVRRAQLTTGAVYSNFSNREELVIAVYIDQYSGRMWDGVAALEQLADSDVRGEEFVDALSRQIVRPDSPEFRASRWLRIRAVAASQRYPEVRAAVSELQHEIASRLVEIVERLQARGDIDPGRDPRAVALLFQQFGFTLVLADLSGDLAPDPDAWVALARDLVLPLFSGRVNDR
jgi:AcrR family transcriptional regulator